MDKNKIKELLNEYFFKSDYIKNNIIKKIKEEGDTLFGKYNPPFNALERINQFLGQSSFIRYGAAIEHIINEIFRANGYESLEKKILSKNYNSKKNKILNLDSHIYKGDRAYVIEIKIRDNHDSTKKDGQAEDFERKYFEASIKNNEKKYQGIIFYVDDGGKKNGKSSIKFLNEKQKQIKTNYQNVFFALYGLEAFKHLGIPEEQWFEFENGLLEWKNDNTPIMKRYNREIAKQKEDILKEIQNAFQNKKISNETYKQVEDVLNNYIED